MNTFLVILGAGLVGLIAWQLIHARPGLPLAEAKAALESGTAVLIDIREPAEWTGGVARQAALLPGSDLQGRRVQWGAFLEKHKGRQLFLYCASGTRSGFAARRLRREGYDAVNVGSFRAWARAGWPVDAPRHR